MSYVWNSQQPKEQLSLCFLINSVCEAVACVLQGGLQLVLKMAHCMEVLYLQRQVRVKINMISRVWTEIVNELVTIFKATQSHSERLRCLVRNRFMLTSTESCKICQDGREHVCLLLSETVQNLRVSDRFCYGKLCRWLVGLELWRTDRDVLLESNDAFDDVISLTAPAWVSVTEMLLSILTHTRIGWEKCCIHL